MGVFFVQVVANWPIVAKRRGIMLNASNDSYEILLARGIRDQNERDSKSEFYIEFFLHIPPSTAILQRLRNAREAVSRQR